MYYKCIFISLIYLLASYFHVVQAQSHQKYQVKTTVKKKVSNKNYKLEKPLVISNASAISSQVIEKHIKRISAQSKAQTLTREVLILGLKAYYKVQKIHPNRPPIITIIDYSKPSTVRRLWVINLKADKILLHDYIGHGSNSGHNRPTKFSNQRESLQSSIGLLLTENKPYRGQYGHALRVIGLEKGFNNNVAVRNIVIHSSPYINEEFTRIHKRLARSRGCFLVSRRIINTLLETIQGGTLILSYYPDPNWLSKSHFLK